MSQLVVGVIQTFRQFQFGQLVHCDYTIAKNPWANANQKLEKRPNLESGVRTRWEYAAMPLIGPSVESAKPQARTCLPRIGKREGGHRGIRQQCFGWPSSRQNDSDPPQRLSGTSRASWPRCKLARPVLGRVATQNGRVRDKPRR